MKFPSRTRKAPRRDAGTSRVVANAGIREIFSFPKGLRRDRPPGSLRRFADASGIAVGAAPAIRPVRRVTQSFQSSSAAC
jgi:hypothetical protein